MRNCWRDLVLPFVLSVKGIQWNTELAFFNMIIEAIKDCFKSPSSWKSSPKNRCMSRHTRSNPACLKNSVPYRSEPGPSCRTIVFCNPRINQEVLRSQPKSTESQESQQLGNRNIAFPLHFHATVDNLSSSNQSRINQAKKPKRVDKKVETPRILAKNMVDYLRVRRAHHQTPPLLLRRRLHACSFRSLGGRFRRQSEGRLGAWKVAPVTASSATD
jgi:hypothetical protein